MGHIAPDRREAVDTELKASYDYVVQAENCMEDKDFAAAQVAATLALASATTALVWASMRESD